MTGEEEDPEEEISFRATLDSYDRFAPAFTERYFQSRGLDAEMDAFLSLLPPNPRILDAGCGPGHHTRYFGQRGAFSVGLDLSFRMLEEGRKCDPGLSLVQGDLLALPFPSHTLEGVWARASLIHLDAASHRRSLLEIHRVLQPGGVLYAAVRQGKGETYRRETQQSIELARYFHFWEAGDWLAEVESAGFQLLESGIEDGEPEDWLWLYARRSSK